MISSTPPMGRRSSVNENYKVTQSIKYTFSIFCAQLLLNSTQNGEELPLTCSET